MTKLEKRIASLHNRKYCILVGNGTTAIYLSLISQNLKFKNIAIPNNVCMNVILAIYFSNNTPIFIDIEKETLGISIENLSSKEIDGLIAIHAYGNVCNIREIQNYCQKNNIFLIEDVAVAQGIKYKNYALGSFGDVSILSFGSGKTINISHGGALLTDSEDIYNKVLTNIEELTAFKPEKENIIDSISKKHTELYNIDYGKSLNMYFEMFKKMCLDNKNNFLSKFNITFENKLYDALNNLDNLLYIRKTNSNYLRNRLININGITILKPKYDSSYWRFSIFIEKYRDELFKYLLKKNYKVSSWYHSVDLLFEKRKTINTPISDWVGENILNIWVNEEIDKKYLDEISDDIINFLRKKNVK